MKLLMPAESLPRPQTLFRILATATSTLALLLCLRSEVLAEPAWLSWEDHAGHRRVRLTVPSDGKAGFREVNGAIAGIHFQNTLGPEAVAANANVMNGSGVAAGDIDGDGWCDLYFCAIEGTNALYRNLGNWTFEDITALAGVALPRMRSTGAVFADLEGDGDLDLLVATLGTGVHAFLNQGRNRFIERTAESGLRTSTGSTSMALADIDGDHDLDLYVANYGEVSLLRTGGQAEMKLVNGQWVIAGPHAKRLRIVDGRLEELGEPDVLWLNDGRGQFQPLPWNSEWFRDERGEARPEPWDYGLSVQMRDLNGDQAPEIYVCNDFQTVDRYWLNDGKGRFRLLPRLAMRKQSFSSMAVDFGDLDRDGHWDFFVTEMMSRKHTDRARQVIGMAPSTSLPGQLEGRPEVARNTLFRNWGDGEYTEIAYFAGIAASDWSWQGLFLDVDLDGYEDLLVCNGMMFDVQDRDVLSQIQRLGRQTPQQSRTNVWLYPPHLSPNVAWRNQHDLTFVDKSSEWGFNSDRISQGMTCADFDNDGDVDLAINTLGAPPLLLRNESVAPRVAVRLRGRSPNTRGIGALVRVSDGSTLHQMQEMLCGGRYLSGDDAIRTFAAGTTTNVLRIEVHWRNGRISTIPDAVSGWLYEIVEPDLSSAPPGSEHRIAEAATSPPTPLFEDATPLLDHTHHEDFFPDYGMQPLLMKLLSQFGPGIAWFDLDADGQQELIVGTGKGGQLEVFRTVNGTFHRIEGTAAWQSPDDIVGLCGWVWADSHRSVLAAIARYESLPPTGPILQELSLDSRSSRFSVSPLPGAELGLSSPGPLAAADLDGDGILELFVGGRLVAGAYPENARSVILRQRNGRLVEDDANSRAVAKVGLVSGATWSDLNLDGFPELILACDWGPVRVLENNRGRLREVTSDLGLAQTTGWWNGVAAGDFDEDGLLDIVASNWGLNGGYTATAEHPLHLYYGRLNHPNTVDLIESYWAPERGFDVPLRGLNALRQAFPLLADHYPSHAAFAQTSMTELLKALPKPAESLAVTSLATTLFLNRRSHFAARPLARDAQLSPAFHIGVADANGDGHEDLFLSQNFFAVRPEWHRMDGGRGLLLLGDGRGSLRPLPGQASGIKVYGEQRGAAWADYDRDGRPDLVVSQNGTRTRLFHNLGAQPATGLSLRGPPGNPEGLGAVVHVTSTTGRTRAISISGAAGYWSQNASTFWIGDRSEAKQVRILWPGGRRQTQAVPPGTDHLVLEWSAAVAVPEP